MLGGGTGEFYRAVIELDRIEAPERDAAGITRAALEGECPAATAALELFARCWERSPEMPP